MKTHQKLLIVVLVSCTIVLVVAMFQKLYTYKNQPEIKKIITVTNAGTWHLGGIYKISTEFVLDSIHKDWRGNILLSGNLKLDPDLTVVVPEKGVKFEEEK